MTAGADAQAAPCAPVRGGGGGVHCPKGGNREDYERLRSCARIALLRCAPVAHGLRVDLLPRRRAECPAYLRRRHTQSSLAVYAVVFVTWRGRQNCFRGGRSVTSKSTEPLVCSDSGERHACHSRRPLCPLRSHPPRRARNLISSLARALADARTPVAVTCLALRRSHILEAHTNFYAHVTIQGRKGGQLAVAGAG